MSHAQIGRRPLLGAALALPSLARAQTWSPERALRWIVAYPAGGGTDSMARVLGAAMAPGLGQPVVIDNRPGAAATLGADAAARAVPDGHTVFSADSGILVNNIALFRKLPYDPERDYRGIGLFCDFPLVIAVPAESRFRDIAQYMAAAQKDPGSIACGTPGIGSPHHLALERFQKEAGIRLNTIPYRGGAPGVNDLMAGTLDSMMVDVASANSGIKGGRIRALAATPPQRWRGLPEVPTLREAGLTEYRAPAWQGLVVPAATPAAARQRLGAELTKVTTDPAIRARLIEIGVEPLSAGPEEFDALIAADRAYWVPLIRSLGISLDT